MTDEEGELMNWAMIGDSFFDAHRSRAADATVLSLIDQGYVVPCDEQPSKEFIRYQVMQAGELARAIWAGRSPEPPSLY